MSSLESISLSVSRPLDFVKNDMQKMIEKKFFANASINTSTNEIIIKNAAFMAQVNKLNNAAQNELEVFTCPGCGALGTKAKATMGNCDYCGSPVK
jgi:hypothetical protein